MSYIQFRRNIMPSFFQQTLESYFSYQVRQIQEQFNEHSKLMPSLEREVFQADLNDISERIKELSTAPTIDEYTKIVKDVYFHNSLLGMWILGEVNK